MTQTGRIHVSLFQGMHNGNVAQRSIRSRNNHRPCRRTHKDGARWIYHGCMTVFNRIARHKDQHGASSFVLRSRKTLSFVTNLSPSLYRVFFYIFKTKWRWREGPLTDGAQRGWWYSCMSDAPVSKLVVSRRRDKRLKSPFHHSSDDV